MPRNPVLTETKECDVQSLQETTIKWHRTFRALPAKLGQPVALVCKLFDGCRVCHLQA